MSTVGGTAACVAVGLALGAGALCCSSKPERPVLTSSPAPVLYRVPELPGNCSYVIETLATGERVLIVQYQENGMAAVLLPPLTVEGTTP